MEAPYLANFRNDHIACFMGLKNEMQLMNCLIFKTYISLPLLRSNENDDDQLLDVYVEWPQINFLS